MDKLTLKRLFAQRGLPQVGFVAVGEEGWRERCRGAGRAALGEAVAARLERRHQPGRGARRASSRPAVELALPPRPAGDRRGLGRAAARSSARCSATRRSRPRRRARSSPTATGTTTRPSTATAAWSWSCRRRSPAEQAERLQELALEAFRLGGCAGLARCDFFVEPDGEVLRQRDQHDARLHRDERLRQALGGRRPRLPATSATGCSASRSSATAAPARTSSELEPDDPDD